MRPALSFSVRARQSAPSRGFTLVEVLMALCIFAMAAVVLGASYVNVLTSYEAVSRGTRVNEDFAFARSLVVMQPDRTKLENGGEFDTAGGGRARWSAEIEQSAVADVFKVTFSCEITEANSTEPLKLTQTFMLLRPTWSTEVAERDKLREEAKTRILEFQGKQGNQKR